ncbi:MAG: carbon-nitrogen hydrolase family protein [Bacillota bacterium]
MRKLTVAALQMGPSGTREENLERMGLLLREAAARGAKIACFPELALTPYFPKHRDLPEADRFFDGPGSKWLEELSKLAAQVGVCLVLPYAERDGDRRYNSALIFDGRGRRAGSYRKVHIPRGIPNSRGEIQNYEDSYFDPGDLGLPVFDLGVARVGLQICYDRHFPEGFRSLALSGAEIIFLPTNSPTYGRAQRRQLWRSLLQVRAYENGVFLVAAGKAGVEEGLEFIGGSAVVSPKGEFEAVAGTIGDEVICATIDLNEVIKARQDLPLTLVRRPELYRQLVE